MFTAHGTVGLRVLRLDSAPFGIRLTAVFTTRFDTPITGHIASTEDVHSSKEVKNADIAKTATGLGFIRTTDVWLYVITAERPDQTDQLHLPIAEEQTM
jgi:hypothetical protein